MGYSALASLLLSIFVAGCTLSRRGQGLQNDVNPVEDPRRSPRMEYDDDLKPDDAVAVGSTPPLALPEDAGLPDFEQRGEPDSGVEMTVQEADAAAVDPSLPATDGAAACFYTADDPAVLAATITHKLESLAGERVVHVRLALERALVDNTYGDNAIGWGQGSKGPKGAKHDLAQFLDGDHAAIHMLDEFGATAFAVELDYLSEHKKAVSGYCSLGVIGGDGRVLHGDPSMVRAVSTSIDRNLNRELYAMALKRSPETDDTYKPNPEAPDWEFSVVYDVWVDSRAFPAGFGAADVAVLYASPFKTGANALAVESGPCPDGFACPGNPGCIE